MSILITGATGMLGAYTLKTLLQSNENIPIHLTYRSDEKKALALKFLNDFKIHAERLESLIWHKGDLMDICFVEDCVLDDMTIYHCAAIVSFNKKEARTMMDVNMRTTEHLINTSINRENVYFLHVSSIAAIGRENIQQIVSETSQWTNSNANSAYAVSKNLAEMEVWRGFQEGVKGAIINPSIILGVFPESKSSLKIFDLANNEFPFYTTGENGFVDVEDVVRSMVLIAEQQVHEERYIISVGNFSYQTIFNHIADGLDKKRPKYKTTMLLGRIALVLEFLKVMFGKPRTLSMDLLKTSLQKNHYNNSKFTETFNFEYTSLENSMKVQTHYYKTLF